ncbi:BICD family-like cargo adapter 1 [Acipenser oxyrinchus oxyrinchus]|uniref:BICD family-like cargo adapter 1 n=1 Tax=Acipenser oxyrinchus oxyrinchus TaxID=40147 RepID=A0AAD8FZ18_ACIOX|nr:BICD family-like cargo adapter 1 [Acipenser oxyrinchus oxyrinchus]
MDRGEVCGLKSQLGRMEEEFYSFDLDAEDLSREFDPSELLAALKQKEQELILAAELGNALLSENRQLKENTITLHEEYSDRLEELEQEKHTLQVKFKARQAEWESQVCELEKDVKELNRQVERLSESLDQAEKDKSHSIQDCSEQNQRLIEQLNKAVQAERSLTAELQTLKNEFQEKNRSLDQEEAVLHLLKEEVVLLSEQKLALEQRINTVCLEDEALKGSLSSLRAQITRLESRSLEQALQSLHGSWRQREGSRQLQLQVEELQEEVCLQDHSQSLHNLSLQSEIEQSLESWGHEKEQITREIHSIREQLQTVVDLETSESPADSIFQSASLHVALSQLSQLAQTLARTHSSQVGLVLFISLEEHCFEQSTVKGNLNIPFSHRRTTSSAKRIRAERTPGDKPSRRQLQQAIRDRDEAIVKKNAMESELLKSRNDMMLLNNQLLEAIHRKLELSQELEAWQDDIQIVINQQLKSQQQRDERKHQPANSTNSLAFLRRPSRLNTENKSFFSLFRT